MFPMKRSSLFVCLMALSSIPCDAATSGTVTDRPGNGLAGVSVSLVLAGTATTTDANGAWSLGTSGVRVLATAAHARWTGKDVELTLATPAVVSLEAYDLKGTLQGRVSSVQLGAGSQSLPYSQLSTGVT
ncbi:MAG: hypothetical protein RL173_1021 [Fibrobacterota bacterium]|jgi:hypothetical protein